MHKPMVMVGIELVWYGGAVAVGGDKEPWIYVALEGCTAKASGE